MLFNLTPFFGVVDDYMGDDAFLPDYPEELRKKVPNIGVISGQTSGDGTYTYLPCEQFNKWNVVNFVIIDWFSFNSSFLGHASDVTNTSSLASIVDLRTKIKDLFSNAGKGIDVSEDEHSKSSIVEVIVFSFKTTRGTIFVRNFFVPWYQSEF